MASEAFDHLFATHVIGMAEKQSHLSDVVGGAGWGVDMGTGLLTIDNIGYGMQVLGTQADGDNSWLWAWANEATGIPESTREKCKQLPSAAGGAVPELVERSFSQDVADGHQLSVVAGGLLDADAYYRCPYEGGQMFVLIFDDKLKPEHPAPVQRFMHGVSKGIAAYAVPNQRLAASAYADSLGLEINEEAGNLTVTDGNEQAVATFDELNRISGIKFNVGGASAAPAGEPKKKRRFFGRNK